MPTVDPYARAKVILAEKQWRRIKYEATFNGHEATLIRQCIAVDDDQQQLCLEYLNTLPSVTAPRAGRKSYPGLWRVVSVDGGLIKPVDGKPPSYGITETLKLGYATSITTGSGGTLALDFTECRVVNVRKRAWAAGTYNAMRPSLEFYWPNIDPTCKAALVNQVRDSLATVVDPTIDGESTPYVGTWILKEADCSREEDGAAVVWAVYAKEPDAVTIDTGASASTLETRSLGRYNTRAAAVAACNAAAGAAATGELIHGDVQRTAEGYEAVIHITTAVLVDSGVITLPDGKGNSYAREVENATSYAGYLPASAVIGNFAYTLEGGVEKSKTFPGLWNIRWHQRLYKQYPEFYGLNTVESFTTTDAAGRSIVVNRKFTGSISAAYAFIGSDSIKGSDVWHNSEMTRFIATYIVYAT